MENSNPNGFILLVRESCSLGRAGELIGTFPTKPSALRAAYATGVSFENMKLINIYEDARVS